MRRNQVVALMFAPESGAQVRERIKSKVDEGAQYLKQCGSELKESATGIVDAGKRTVTCATDNVAEAVDAGKQAYTEALKS
jgi:gas vesicle protein